MVLNRTKTSRQTDSQVTYQGNHEKVDGSRRNILIGGAAIVATMGLPTPALAVHPEAANAPASRKNNQGEGHVNTATTKDGTKIYFKDWGTGQPVVFSHGWPLTADAWDAQMLGSAQESE
jgi:non-heme chloroperoxidase